MDNNKIPVGISSCLMGDEVRFNGGHKRSRLCVDSFSRVFEYQRFCPEVAIGMGVPREAIRMVGSIESPRVVGTKNLDLDVTDELYAYGQKIGRLSHEMSGYILMKDSPSCGLHSAKIYSGESPLQGRYAGMFVRGLVSENALIPMEEDGRLNDAVLRENFVAAVYAFHDWRTGFMLNPSPAALIEFHSRYKFLAMAHGQEAYKVLGRIVANAGAPNFDVRVKEYITAFMQYMKKPASRKGHVNALYHILGYLREGVASDIRTDIGEMIDSYRQGFVNLSVPATMLNHYIKRYGGEYIKAQVYLRPYNEELGLRNTI